MSLNPEDRARRSAEAMWAGDAASKWVGMTLEAVGPGTATTRMTVAGHHTNGHGICHGGVIFALADSAFAFACNSYNRSAVAQHNTISFIAPGKLGDTLTATAREISLAGRNGIYDVTVTDGTGATIAEFRGCSRIINGSHFEEEGTP
ncbi:hydroxyphenylacetyl-CoA thioesterase PaaI [Maritimibacter sp. 55A14]|uniref:hydroxyphenylacetyl-CoA thioesterase PaaI n=1 Tax=Maritimibacter sp. 55A14 TaxID=2174844 RepID=UPI000D60D5EE|nr:hydroxyphenylacetyl-CoA thioesterase PaaI [Maritimibacter sp. 55A14]PWE32824.1 hydroxyphenylacetyl-CoA thioesterase PaaI [Maritimibacter sp. 55A14]